MPTSIGALPSVDVLSGGLDEARGYEKISEALSRVSAFAFEKLGERRQREGEQFRLENPITAEQIEAALSEGRSVDEIVGDPDTVFGRASRSTAVMQLETELEGQARSVIAELTGRLDGGEPIDAEYIQQAVGAMTEGHADLLAKMDPKRAYKYRAAVAAMAAPLYRDALEKEIKFARTERVIRFEAEKLDFLPTLTKAYKTYGPDTNGIVRIQAEGVMASAINTADPEIVKQAQQFIIKQDEQARIDAIVQYNQENPGEIDALNQKFGKFQNLFKEMSQEMRDKVIDTIRADEDARDKAANERNAEEKSRQKRVYRAAVIAAKQSKPGSEEHAASMERVRRGYELGLLERTDYDNANTGEESGISNDAVATVKTMIRRGEITSRAQLDALQELGKILDGANASQMDSLDAELDREMDAGRRGAATSIRRASGIIDIPGVIQNISMEASEKAEFNVRMMEEEYKTRNAALRAAGKPELTYKQVADIMIKEGLRNTQTQNLDDLKNRLQDFLKEAKIQLDLSGSIESLKSFLSKLNDMEGISNANKEGIRTFLNEFIMLREGLRQ
jgi:hypothetical protein